MILPSAIRHLAVKQLENINPSTRSKMSHTFENDSKNLVNGASCRVIGGTHKGKSGTVGDINTSKTGHVTITVTQSNGVRFKTLARNVEVVVQP